MSSRAPLSPVLLIGAGTGEATCGILYLASYLRRHGIEAYVRLTDADETDEEIVVEAAQLRIWKKDLATVKKQLKLKKESFIAHINAAVGGWRKKAFR